jgi:hypothetical protein
MNNTPEQEAFYTSPDSQEAYIAPDVELTDIDLDTEYEAIVTENIYNDQSVYDHGYSDGYAAALKTLSENPTV